MNKKLTKEQAYELMSRISGVFHSATEHPISLAIQKVIDECTEKEFPELLVRSHVEGEWTKVSCWETVKRLHICNNSNRGNQISIEFDVEQFKTFTEGCNKIVEWLDEQ